MNRRFFLKLFPAASAAVALPAVVAASSGKIKHFFPPAIASKWQGDGYCEVVDGTSVEILSVVRWSAFDCKNDGRCYRFSPVIPGPRGEIVYRYEYIIDDYLVRKVEKEFWRANS